MSSQMKFQKSAIFIFGVILVLCLTPKSFAESATKQDLADVLPNADIFAGNTDPFVHYLGYRTDGGHFMGVCFVTTDVVPDESWGYRDQIATLVGVNALGKITGVKVLSEYESPRYTKGFLEDDSPFLTQFEEMDAGDNFLLNSDIDAITGATITSSTVTRSIKSGLQLVTEQILKQPINKDNIVKHLLFDHLLWQMDFIFLWAILALAYYSFLQKNQSLRYLTMGLSFTYIGILMGGGFSINDVLRLLSLHFPVFLNNLYWYSLVVIALVLAFIAGRFYCGWLCPFGTVLEILYMVTPTEWTISETVDGYFKLVKYLILVTLLMVAFWFRDNIAATYIAAYAEPFATFFNLHGDLISWILLLLMLFLSCGISRFYCRYFCPLGAFFALLVLLSSWLKIKQLSVELPNHNCKGCKVAQRGCKMKAISYDEQAKKPEIAIDECFMCNTCAAICPVESKKL